MDGSWDVFWGRIRRAWMVIGKDQEKRRAKGVVLKEDGDGSSTDVV